VADTASVNGLDVDNNRRAHTTTPLGAAPLGFRGRVHSIVVSDTSSGLSETELETRLLELGFVEGEPVEILHQGAFGGDPIAVRIASTTIALRRREAMSIMVEGAAP
jgi:ferrous iron transport protein A